MIGDVEPGKIQGVDRGASRKLQACVRARKARPVRRPGTRHDCATRHSTAWLRLVTVVRQGQFVDIPQGDMWRPLEENCPVMMYRGMLCQYLKLNRSRKEGGRG